MLKNKPYPESITTKFINKNRKKYIFVFTWNDEEEERLDHLINDLGTSLFWNGTKNRVMDEEWRVWWFQFKSKQEFGVQITNSSLISSFSRYYKKGSVFFFFCSSFFQLNLFLGSLLLDPPMGKMVIITTTPYFFANRTPANQWIISWFCSHQLGWDFFLILRNLY